MLTSFVLLFAPMAAAQSGVPATAETEMLGVDVPDEFEVGYQARNDTQQMIELVDPPETVETWTRLITLQSFFGAAQKESARTFYERWRAGMHRTCVGMTDAVFVGVVDGKPAIRGDLSCPKNPQTGKPENVCGSGSGRCQLDDGPSRVPAICDAEGQGADRSRHRIA